MSNITAIGAPSYKMDGMDLPARSITAAASQARGRVDEIEIDSATQRPVPPRFPWLSRLSAELEIAARQRPPFPPTAALGNNLDKTA